MEIVKRTRLFLDLGANKGQSLVFYRELFSKICENVDVITVEPSNDFRVLDELKNNINQLSKFYKSIF